MLPPRDSPEFPLALKTLREKFEISRTRLTDLCDISHGSISRFENTHAVSFTVPSETMWNTLNRVMTRIAYEFRDNPSDEPRVIKLHDAYNGTVKTNWVPVLPRTKIKQPVRPHVTYMVYVNKIEISNRADLKAHSWDDCKHPEKVSKTFTDLSDARKLYSILKNKGLYVVRDWTE